MTDAINVRDAHAELHARRLARRATGYFLIAVGLLLAVVAIDHGMTRRLEGSSHYPVGWEERRTTDVALAVALGSVWPLALIVHYAVLAVVRRLSSIRDDRYAAEGMNVLLAGTVLLAPLSLHGLAWLVVAPFLYYPFRGASLAFDAFARHIFTSLKFTGAAHVVLALGAYVWARHAAHLSSERARESAAHVVVASALAVLPTGSFMAMWLDSDFAERMETISNSVWEFYVGLFMFNLIVAAIVLFTGGFLLPLFGRAHRYLLAEHHILGLRHPNEPAAGGLPPDDADSRSSGFHQRR